MSELDMISLDVRDLAVAYGHKDGGSKQVVEGFSLALRPGRIHGLAGESGCGKSTAALAAIGYVKPGTQLLSGQSVLDGDEDILALGPAHRRALWGNRIGYVPQSASMSLNPGTTISRQLAQPLKHHLGLRGSSLRQRQVELLDQVGVPNPEAALRRYPFQFSGGQQQRISLAIALACKPTVLILDEPTTGLDVTTQARITKLLRGLVNETGLSALYVSHDLALLGEVADDLAVMYAGEIVERSPVGKLVRGANGAKHPYTRALLDVALGAERGELMPGIPGTPPGRVALESCAYSTRCAYSADICTTTHPRPRQVEAGHDVACLRWEEVAGDRPRGRQARPRTGSSAGEPLLTVSRASLTYPGAATPSLHDVDLELYAGESLGIVGESGSGKSTLLRVIAGLASPSSGTVALDAEPLSDKAARRPKAVRQAVQLIPQNPDSSLNPRHSIGQTLSRPIRLFRDEVGRAEETEIVEGLLEAVRLPRTYLHKYPRELSGGQRQRVAIARAFAADPRLLLCDEVTSALDVSVQATVLELLAELSLRTGTGVIFVGHDLAVVRTIADRSIVMRGGEVVETGHNDQLFTAPQHEYTRELLAARPSLSGDSGGFGVS